jgi:hypothetical protein
MKEGDVATVDANAKLYAEAAAKEKAEAEAQANLTQVELAEYYRDRRKPGMIGFGGRKTRKLGNKFNRCVKSVRSTVKARKGSNKESAAIAICTTSVLHPRGRTIKRYRKKRLITQKKFRGGCGNDWCS